MLLRRTNKQCEQNLRFTNNAHKIREISPKKFWLLNWTPTKISRNLRACSVEGRRSVHMNIIKLIGNRRKTVISQPFCPKHPSFF